MPAIPLQKFTIKHISGETVTVAARSEREARHPAMLKKWGPPTGIYRAPYMGLGLVIVGVEPCPA